MKRLFVLYVCSLCALVLTGCTEASGGTAIIGVRNESESDLSSVKIIGLLNDPGTFGNVPAKGEASIEIWNSLRFDKKAGVFIEYVIDGKKLRSRLDTEKGFPDEVKAEDMLLKIIFTKDRAWKWSLGKDPTVKRR
jgi:hypothetical protein